MNNVYTRWMSCNVYDEWKKCSTARWVPCKDLKRIDKKSACRLLCCRHILLAGPFQVPIGPQCLFVGLCSLIGMCIFLMSMLTSKSDDFFLSTRKPSSQIEGIKYPNYYGLFHKKEIQFHGSHRFFECFNSWFTTNDVTNHYKEVARQVIGIIISDWLCYVPIRQGPRRWVTHW